MRKFHTNVAWFGEPTTTLAEERSTPLPEQGEKAMFSGGRVVEFVHVSVPRYFTDGYARKRYWKVNVEIKLLS